MTDRNTIEELVKGYADGKGLFPVAIKISPAGKITVLVDSHEGITIDECAELSRYLENNLDREKEDYELQVSSPGLDMPFLVIEQYRKNQGRQVEVTGTDGKKLRGILKNVTEGGFELEVTVKAKKGTGNKKADTSTTDISFNYEQVKSARETVTFK